MADQIVDRRIQLFAADALTSSADLSGATGAGTLDTEIFIQGSGSIGNYVSNSLSGIMYDAGTAQNWSGSAFYVWVNSGIVGLLQTRANGGFRIRFAGATASNFFEVYVGGSDSWPNAISGGWTQFVVDVEVARAEAIANGWTGGTPPATTAIRYVGYAAVTVGMPRMADNTWLDEIRRLPPGEAAVTIEGRNGGTNPWTWADVRAQLGVASGVVKDGPGGSYVLNGPIQFGFADASTHHFADTSQVLLWDDQEFIDDGLYRLTAAGGAGTTTVEAGIKTGTGVDATGARGWIIQAAATGARWSADFTDPDLDLVGLWGSTLIHAGTLTLDDPAVSVVSSQYIDCSKAFVDGSEQTRNSVIAPNTLTSVAFMELNDLSALRYCEFESGGVGHAVRLFAPLVASQQSQGNVFTGYADNLGTAGNRALFNDQGGAVTINVSDGGDSPSVRNGTGATTDVISAVVFRITGLVDNTEVRIYRVSDDVELFGEENSSGGEVTYAYNFEGSTPVYIHIHHIQYVPIRLELTLGGEDAAVPVQQRFDRAYSNPQPTPPETPTITSPADLATVSGTVSLEATVSDLDGGTVRAVWELWVPGTAGAVLDSFATPGSSPLGLTHDGTNLRSSDSSSTPDLIYKINPADGTVIDSILTPSTQTSGLAWDGTNLWACDYGTDLIYKINPADGTVIDSFAAPGGIPFGLTHDGMNLWVCDLSSRLIYKLDPANGAVLDSFASPGGVSPASLTWDGTNLWHGDYGTDLIYKINPADGTVIDSFAAPDGIQSGLAWDGTNLWCSDRSTDLIYKLDPGPSLIQDITEDVTLVTSGTTHTTSWDVSAIDPGTYVLRAWAVDSGGLQSADYDSHTITI